MKWRRNNYDIIASIAKLALHGTYKTYIMYQCKLSFEQLEQYISFLLEAGILTAEDSLKKMSGPKSAANTHIIYRTTTKGRRYLEKFDEIKKLLDAKGDDIWLPRQLQVAT